MMPNCQSAGPLFTKALWRCLSPVLTRNTCFLFCCHARFHTCHIRIHSPTGPMVPSPSLKCVQIYQKHSKSASPAPASFLPDNQHRNKMVARLAAAVYSALRTFPESAVVFADTACTIVVSRVRMHKPQGDVCIHRTLTTSPLASCPDNKYTSPQTSACAYTYADDITFPPSPFPFLAPCKWVNTSHSFSSRPPPTFPFS